MDETPKKPPANENPKLETGFKTDLTGFEANIGISEAAKGADETIRENRKLSEQNRPPGTPRTETGIKTENQTTPLEGEVIDKYNEKPSSGGWRNWPKAICKTDDQGNVIFHKSGKKKGRPKMKGLLGGRPRKAKPGEELAGGGFAPGGPPQGAGVTRVVDPMGSETQGDSAQDAAGPRPQPMAGEEAGKLIVELMDEAASSIDPRFKMKDFIRSGMDKSYSAVLWGIVVPAIVLAIGFTVYWVGSIFAVLISDNKKKKQKVKVEEDERHAQPDNRKNQKREDSAGEKNRRGNGQAAPESEFSL